MRSFSSWMQDLVPFSFPREPKTAFSVHTGHLHKTPVFLTHKYFLNACIMKAHFCFELYKTLSCTLYDLNDHSRGLSPDSPLQRRRHGWLSPFLHPENEGPEGPEIRPSSCGGQCGLLFSPWSLAGPRSAWTSPGGWVLQKLVLPRTQCNLLYFPAEWACAYQLLPCTV